MTTSNRALRTAIVLTTLLAAPAVTRAEETLTFGLPAIPPVFVTVQAYVAQQEKIFDKYGVKVTLRPFDSGANAARATVVRRRRLRRFAVAADRQHAVEQSERRLVGDLRL